MEKINLMIPIFGLYEINSLKEVFFSIDSSNYLKNGYNLQDRIKIYEDLKWAQDNPGYDFKGLMDDAPVPYKLKFSNKEIFKYLMDFKNFMEMKDFELLTDDRDPLIF